MISRRANKVFNFASGIFCLTPMAAHFAVARTTDLRDDVAGEGDAGSPGSGGASPYLRRDSPRQPDHFLSALAYSPFP
jgi:hypothetical protein